MQIKIDDLEAYIITLELKEGIIKMKELLADANNLNDRKQVARTKSLIAKYKELIKRIEQMEED